MLADNPHKVYRTELSPVSFLRRSASIYPEKTAIIHYNRRYSYKQFEERVNRLSNRLLSLGLKKHDRVAFLCPNIPALLEAHFAIPAAGGILVPINTRLNAEEIGYILQHSGAGFLFIDSEFSPLVGELDLSGITVIGIEDSGLGDDPYEQFLSEGSAEPVESPLADEEEPVTLNYTSGTTGRPKGVLYTHRGAYLNSLGEIIEVHLDSDSVYLWTLPMFHCNGWCFPWTVAMLGGTHVCLRRVEAPAILAAMREHGVDHYCAAPIVHNLIIAAPDEMRAGIRQKVRGMVAGAAPPAAMIEGMAKLGFDITHVYGLTEVYGPASVAVKRDSWAGESLSEQARLNGRQGVRYVLQDGMTVMDPEMMRETPADGQTMGEIMFRGNIVMKGYLKNPKSTDKAFEGGWFHTGDLAVMEPDRYVKIKDRSKDIIISGGENISSIEVEDALYRHPAVMACAVVARPHPKWGETPLAFVELKPGASPSADELIAHCKGLLAGYKVPREIRFEPIPKTSTGKIQKFQLRERAKSASAIE